VTLTPRKKVADALQKRWTTEITAQDSDFGGCLVINFNLSSENKIETTLDIHCKFKYTRSLVQSDKELQHRKERKGKSGKRGRPTRVWQERVWQQPSFANAVCVCVPTAGVRVNLRMCVFMCAYLCVSVRVFAGAPPAHLARMQCEQVSRDTTEKVSHREPWAFMDSYCKGNLSVNICSVKITGYDYGLFPNIHGGLVG